MKAPAEVSVVPRQESQGMDVPRPVDRPRRRRKRIIMVAAGLAVLVALGVLVARLEPRAYTVDRSALWIGKVERGPLVRQVKCGGTFVPETVLWLSATTPGRVERILAVPGTTVQPASPVVDLSNPQIEQEELDAKAGLAMAEAGLAGLRASLESEAMSVRSEAVQRQADASDAQLRSQAEDELARAGLVSDIERQTAQTKAESAKARAEIEKQRESVFAGGMRAQLAAKAAEVEQRRALLDLRQRLAQSLHVRAGMAGVLQDIMVQPGQEVAAGASLARVAEPTRLRARLLVPAGQAVDVRIGQHVTIDSRPALVGGRVVNVDPAVHDGTVTVDCALTGDPPSGARPDLAIEATIEIERITDTLFLARPAFAQERTTVGLFRVEADGRHARRVQVVLGRASTTTIEVVSGLSVGDEVILSDTTRWDEQERVRLR
ncbi:MAG: HlyD family efflux transporter periplasmic adaptor subunit [Desulfomonilaceae bacterium]